MNALPPPRLEGIDQLQSRAKKYDLECVECGSLIHPHSFNFNCREHEALVRSRYLSRQINLFDLPGLWRFFDWLPVQNINCCNAKPITYKSRHLAADLGLKKLFISFSGYWPERGAFVKTCTFKEFEAIVSLRYAQDNGVSGPLVVASAGNTANAFAYVASVEHYPVILVVPKRCLCDVWVPELDPAYVKTVVVEDGDYADAISIAKRLAAINNFIFEGGAVNVARRDGLATVLLDAVIDIGALPQHYFQAVGSGTGAISAWEASLRLVGDGRFGKRPPKFHLSQNLPFAPMVNAWAGGRRRIIPDDLPKEKNVLDLVFARVLSNRYPPYGVAGGVFDVLKATKGKMYAVGNEEAERAGKLFESREGIDILPAAAVAVASLIKAVESSEIRPNDVIVLNITGGGRLRLEADMPLFEIEPNLTVSKQALDEKLKWPSLLKLKKD